MIISLLSNEFIKNIAINDKNYVLDTSTPEMAEQIEGFLLQRGQDEYHLMIDKDKPAVMIVANNLHVLLADLHKGKFISEENVALILGNKELQEQIAETQAYEKTLDEFLAELDDDSLDATSSSEIDANKAKSDHKGKEESFESVEHRAIGNFAFDRFIKSHDDLMSLLDGQVYNEVTKAGSTWVTKLPNGVPVAIGDIVALAGDFFGVPDKPIAHGKDDIEKKIRFLNAYATLEQAPADRIRALLQAFQREAIAVETALAEGRDPAQALANLNKQHAQDIKYTKMTRGSYISIAIMNFDHFGDDAKEAYRIGHTIAMNMAARARREEGERQIKYLVRALAYEAFACHFLTDLFAAGHMRTPRRELSNELHSSGVSFFADTRAAYRAYKMHHEDNEKGLFVKSTRYPEPWKAFGDGHLNSAANKDNLEKVIEAMQDGLDDVYDAFQNPENEFKYTYLEHLPDYRDCAGNHEPMYKVVDGKIQRRADVKEVSAATSAPTTPLNRLHQWALNYSPYLFKHASKPTSKPAQAVSTGEKAEVEAMYQELEQSTKNCCFR